MARKTKHQLGSVRQTAKRLSDGDAELLKRIDDLISDNSPDSTPPEAPVQPELAEPEVIEAPLEPELTEHEVTETPIKPEQSAAQCECTVGESTRSFDPSTAFCRSVALYRTSVSDTGSARRKSLPRLLASCVMLAVCVAVFCYSAYLIAERALETYTENIGYTEIRIDENAQSAIEMPKKMREPSPMLTLYQTLSVREDNSDYEITDAVQSDEHKKYFLNYLSLKQQYPDAYAWIRLTGTNIDYPLMFSAERDFYLYHNYKGESAKSGSIFASVNTRRDYLSNYNLVTYGHCMSNGTMYRGIKLWFDSRTRKEDAKDMYIYVYNSDGVYIYKLFSAYRSEDPAFAREIFYSESDYVSWLKSIYRQSRLSNKFSYNADTRILTMITCTNVYSNPDERYVVHGILVKHIPASDLTAE